MCGGYGMYYLRALLSCPSTDEVLVNNDDYISRLRLLKFGRKEMLDNLGNVKLNSRNPYYFI
jgi:hypothetical protein